MNTSKFADYIGRKCESLDDEIIASMHPLDSERIGHVTAGSFQPAWWNCRESVRKIVEGIAFKSSRKVQVSSEGMYDRFENVFPKLSGCK
jgi:hypothetical protein